MFSSLRQVLAHSQLRLLAFMIFVQGSAYGSTLPYLSVTAIRELGISDQFYSVLLLVTSLTAVTISVSLGILSDMIGDRRRIIVAMAALGTLGYGAIFLFPSVPVFVIATAIVLPFFQSISSLLFASVRAATAGFANRDAAAINATVRAFMSASWVVAPAAMGLLFAGAGSMLGAWGTAAGCATMILLSAIFLLRREGRAARTSSGPGFFASLKDLAAPVMLGRMALMAAVTGTIRLASTVWPLILTVNLAAGTANVGVIAGLIALFEIPFMLMWAGLLKRLSILTILTVAAILYAGFMAALTFATESWQIYALTVPAAAGASALLSMPLTYFQELFPGRPGLGTAFNPINSFVGNGLTALAFAGGAHFLGYSGTAWLGVVMAIAGIAGLRLLERRHGATRTLADQA
jgi:SET family sugar efflux transporter-like MFS transporter